MYLQVGQLVESLPAAQVGHQRLFQRDLALLVLQLCVPLLMWVKKFAPSAVVRGLPSG